MCTQEPGKGSKVDAVTLTTIHKAKGLEWDVVVLRACNRGQLPMHFKPPPLDYPSPAVPLAAPFVPPNHSVRLKGWLYSRLTRLCTRCAVLLRARRMQPVRQPASVVLLWLQPFLLSSASLCQAAPVLASAPTCANARHRPMPCMVV